MLAIQITGFYAGILALIFIAASINIIKLRFRHKVGIGDGEVSELAKAIRGHANFAEFVPLALILMAIAEANNISSTMLHSCGALLVAGRVSHLIGLAKTKGSSIPRALGVFSTYGVILACAIANILNYL